MTHEAKIYHILIKDLELITNIGVHQHEKLQPQRVRINLDMAVYEQQDLLSDDLSQVLSYEDVIESIKSLLCQGHINLVETLAEKIATLCLEYSRVDIVKVRVEKPDIYAEAEAVGVEIIRKR